jgi:hypothetical protein
LDYNFGKFKQQQQLPESFWTIFLVLTAVSQISIYSIYCVILICDIVLLTYNLIIQGQVQQSSSTSFSDPFLPFTLPPAPSKHVLVRQVGGLISSAANTAAKVIKVCICTERRGVESLRGGKVVY